LIYPAIAVDESGAAALDTGSYGRFMASTDRQYALVMTNPEIVNVGIGLPETRRSKMRNEWLQSGRKIMWRREFFAA